MATKKKVQEKIRQESAKKRAPNRRSLTFKRLNQIPDQEEGSPTGAELRKQLAPMTLGLTAAKRHPLQ